MKTAAELQESRKQLMSALHWLDERGRVAAERVMALEADYPQLLAQAAKGELEETRLTTVAAELARLRALIAEPRDKAAAIILGQMKLVDDKLQEVRSIRRSRDEDLAFRKFFNEILRRQRFLVDEEERLRQMARINRKAAVDRLCAELGEYEFKAAGPVPVRFGDVVTIEPFSEEPDLSEIRV